jgi:hypothetical protein
VDTAGVPLVCIALLALLRGVQVVLNATDRCSGLLNNVGSKVRLLSRLNLVEWSVTSTSVQHFERAIFRLS